MKTLGDAVIRLRGGSLSAFLFALLLTTLAFKVRADIHTIDPHVVTNASQLAEQAFSVNHALYIPFTAWEWQAYSTDGVQPWWIDCSQWPCLDLSPASTNVNGIALFTAHLTKNVLTGEVAFQSDNATDVLARVEAPSDYQPGVNVEDRGVWFMWQEAINCPDCWGIDSEVPPPTVSLKVFLADVQNKPTWDEAVAAQEAAWEQAQAEAGGNLAASLMLGSEDSAGDVETLTTDCSATNVFQVTKIDTTVEKSITLRWNSQCNAIYRLDYASELSTNTTWQMLHDNYPSHGTTTFWTDTGDYLQAPAIERPQNVSKRFYRISYLGTNSITPPSVSVIFPTNGVVLSGEVTVTVVTASSTLPIRNSYLYVDGEQMYSSEDGSNFVINTCEWPNGHQTLFATVKGVSQFSDPLGSPQPDVAYAASPYVLVTFSNFISRVAFSQPFFEPALGQTQQVTATFGTNTSWTLQIQDGYGNTVRNGSGSGASMIFNWDGTGDGGSNIANGVYYYVISAQTGGSSFAGETTTATSTTTAPTRPPTAPVKGSAGTVGVAYWHFPTPQTYSVPPNGLPLGGNSGKVEIEGAYGSRLFPSIPQTPNMMEGFAATMKNHGWKVAFNLPDSRFRVNDLRSAEFGGSEMFSNVNLGFFGGHGTYGTSVDYHADASESLETYLVSDNSADASAPWIRFSECGFGGQLRWMGLSACWMLRDDNLDSMLEAGVLPITSNLHLLCAASTLSYATDNLGYLWASKMFPRGFLWSTPAETVMNAWNHAGEEAYRGVTNITSTVIFRVAGWDNCFGDTLQSYAGGTSGTFDWRDQPVFTP